MQQDHTEALENLATTIKADREAVSLWTKQISELISQVTTITKNLATANNTIVSLKRNNNLGAVAAAEDEEEKSTTEVTIQWIKVIAIFGHVVGGSLT